MRAPRYVNVAVLTLVACFVTSCGSSSKDTANDSTTTTVAGAAGECPFNGSTEPQSEPGPNTATELTSVTPTPAGCIDNVTFGFSPALATSNTAYESPAPAGGGAVLLVTLENTTLGGGLEAGTVTVPDNVNYVSKVELDTSQDTVVWRITLDKQRPFLVSSSNVPAELVLAIG